MPVTSITQTLSRAQSSRRRTQSRVQSESVILIHLYIDSQLTLILSIGLTTHIDMMLRRLLPRAVSAQRFYSTPSLAAIDASKLQITKSTTPKELTPPEDLVFGRSFTDHMLSCEWTASSGMFEQGTKVKDIAHVSRMACSKNYTLPEPLPRSSVMCIPLCVRMLRGHESLQG